SNLITRTAVGAGIPYDHEDNQWHWGIQANDTFYFETEMIVTNLSSPTQEISAISRFPQILNITSIENRTQNFMGEDLFSEVNMTMLYYDHEDDELKVFPGMSPSAFAIFCYNESHMFKERYFSQSLLPFIVPINGTWDNEVEVLDDIIYNTMYSPFYAMGFLSRFNIYGADSGSNTMWFQNSTDGYHIDLSYGNDGVIENCNASFIMYQMGQEFLYELKAQRVYDYDLTDEISWGVNVGDTFYYDQSSDSSGIDYQDIRIVISGFNESVYEILSMMGPLNMTFQNVLANISIWDGTQYVLTYINSTIGSANNLYPVNIYSAGGMYFTVIPTSYTIEDVEFFIKYMSYVNQPFPFDQTYIFEKDGYLWTELNSSISDDISSSKFNSTNGVLESMLQIMEDEINIASYRKDLPAPWKWSVSPGDIIYLKENSVDPSNLREVDYRATVTAFGGVLIDMSYLLAMLGITDQPLFQFAYTVNATFYEWNPFSETWISSTHTPYLAAGNDYWPIMPAFFPQYLCPVGTTGADFQILRDLMGAAYDEFTYTSNSATIRNSTENKALYFHFNGLTGIIDYSGGWLADYGYWRYISGYIKNIVMLNSGVNVIPIVSEQITDIVSTFQITTSGPGASYLYAMLSQNPVNESIPIGTPLFYFDQLIINSILIIGNMTMTITFPSSIDLSAGDLHFFAWNISGTSQWEEAPQEFYDSIIYNYVTNSIIVETPPPPFTTISCVSFEPNPPGSFTLDSNAGTPDDDGNFTLTWDAADNAVSYSVYEYSGYITVINGTLTRLADHITDLSLALTGYSNGTYYFIVVAHNAVGDTLSNCIVVTVEIPPEAPEEGEGGGIISGYPLYLLLTLFIVITSILIKKHRKKS
ncbi:MAG: hypothetical protein ACFFBK_13195, partial [Promethearchaeota archaeon]